MWFGSAYPRSRLRQLQRVDAWLCTNNPTIHPPKKAGPQLHADRLLQKAQTLLMRQIFLAVLVGHHHAIDGMDDPVSALDISIGDGESRTRAVG